MVTVHERVGRGRGRDGLTTTAINNNHSNNNNNTSNMTATTAVTAPLLASTAMGNRLDGVSDSANEPVGRKSSRKTRGTSTLSGRGKSIRGHDTGNTMPGLERGRRGGGRGGHYGRSSDRRFDSDDDDSWYVRGEPEELEPEVTIPHTAANPKLSIEATAVHSYKTSDEQHRLCLPSTIATTSTEQQRTRRRRSDRDKQPSHYMKGSNTRHQPLIDDTDALESFSRDTTGLIHSNERQLFDPTTGTLQTASKGAGHEGSTTRRHRTAKSRDLSTSHTHPNVSVPVTEIVSERDSTTMLRSTIIHLEKRIASVLRDCDDKEAIDTIIVNTVEHSDTTEYWRNRLDLCQNLLNYYTQWAEIHPTMDGLPNAYGRIWKFGVYQCMDALRRRIKYKTTLELNKMTIANNEDSTGPNQTVTDNLRRLLNEHISMAEEFYQSALYRLSSSSSSSLPSRPLIEMGLWSCVMALGDLSRYRGMFGLASGGEVETLRRYWLKKSRAWYRWAARFTPDHGKVYNQLAILASHHEFEAFYYYSRSLTADKHFDNARESLVMLIEMNRTRYASSLASVQLSSDLYCNDNGLSGYLFNYTACYSLKQI
ncbi:hypothetical protein BDF19DRAFT_107222 [Syncephalis fuscata]|nr:hypothetical protein BDF19DRAFT_107222 [Syncephalis fuscata]